LSRIHLIIPDSHATPGQHNKRAEWVGHLINDIKPDVVVHLGDSADMSSLSSYDRGTKSFQGRNYRADIDSHLDFNDRLWTIVKEAKKKLPYRVFLVGNHENRISKAINLQPELEGAISLRDLCLDEFYDQVVHYNARSPGVTEIDGIHYAHFFVGGVMGKPIGGAHPAYSIITKGFVSSTAGDLHLLDYRIATGIGGKRIQGLVAGCYQDYDAPWAGESNKLWWRGVVIKRDVSGGLYNPQFISIEALKREYGT
jgi:hypothetical protein